MFWKNWEPIIGILKYLGHYMLQWWIFEKKKNFEKNRIFCRSCDIIHLPSFCWFLPCNHQAWPTMANPKFHNSKNFVIFSNFQLSIFSKKNFIKILWCIAKWQNHWNDSRKSLISSCCWRVPLKQSHRKNGE